ncbi:MAG: hypothetical protein SFU21_17010 [Flavihumibacter sp.]|nr:hypothetical protein [Flavihumibacter sp.]
MQEVLDIIKNKGFIVFEWPYWLMLLTLILLPELFLYLHKSKQDSSTIKRKKYISRFATVIWTILSSYCLLYFWLNKNYGLIFLSAISLIRPVITKLIKAAQKKLDAKVDEWAGNG